MARLAAPEKSPRLNNGATEEEIVEVFYQVAVYAGFAAAWDGLDKLKRMLENR